MRASVLAFSMSLLVAGFASAQESLNVRLVGCCGTTDAHGVAVMGNHAYVADGDGGLRVISVSDPAHPVEVGYCDTPGSASAVSVSGDSAYVADWSAGLRVVSVADTTHPVEVGYYVASGTASDVAVDDECVYLANGAGGLQIYQSYMPRVEEGWQHAANSSRPTPTIVGGVLCVPASSVVHGASSVLLDIGGRKVMDLRPGANDVRTLAPGVYFVRELPRAPSYHLQAVRKVILTD